MNDQRPVPFFRPSIGEEEIAEVLDSIRSGWLTTGPKTTRFEAAFAEYLGGGIEAVAVNSATAALHLALEAMGIGPGDEVICPTLTFTATAEVVRYLGAEPVLVDSDPATFNISIKSIEDALTNRTRAIMPVHFAGLACDMTAIQEMAKKYDLGVLDDAAHALPTEHRGARIGATGADATAFSFYANKTITTGEGGMLVTANTEIASRARKMRLHGIDRDVFDRFTNHVAPWTYDVVAPGYKYNMTDIAASLGIHQLARADVFQRQREALALRYDVLLSELPLILPPRAKPGDLHSWHLYIIRVLPESGISRDECIHKLQEAGISCSVHYRPLHKMSYWRKHCGVTAEDFPGAEEICSANLSLPLFMSMSHDEQDRVVTVLRRILGG